MTNPSGARWALRAATQSGHAQVDALLSTLNLGDRAEYGRFLAAQARAFLPVEAGLDRVDLAAVLPDWPGRRRSEALVADMEDLGAPLPPASPAAAFGGVEAALGAIYVLEGSRLGGRVLARSVAPGLPRRFLEAGDPAHWRKLIAVLDATLVTEVQLAVAIEAARAVFARFAAGARCHIEDPCA